MRVQEREKWMQSLLPQILTQIEQHRLPELPLDDEMICPYYDGLSLVNLPSSICHWLGIPAFAGAPLASPILDLYPQDVRHVILLVIDGFGLDTFQAALEQGQSRSSLSIWGELAHRGALAPLTSIAPSTTSSALTTFWTGCAPAEHGVMGYEMWLKEYGVLANMIYHSPASFLRDTGSLRKAGFNPETFLPIPTLGPHLERHGVRPYAFQHASIAHSGLSTMLFAGVKVVPFRSLGDLWVTLSETLASNRDQPSYNYIYWGDLDEHSHRFGPGDERVALEFDSFSIRLGDFIRRHTRGDTLLLITADHGHISTPTSTDYEVRNHPALLDCLVMQPSGEARLPYVYLRPGYEERFLSYLDSAWGGQFRAVPSQQAVRAGLFGGGKTHERLADRVGDYVIIPRDGAYWWFSSRDNPLLGRHGGLSRDEMLVPLLSVLI
jgi:hypothetical protein